jgi:SsrA-binding protein
MPSPSQNGRAVATNRRARRDFEILDAVEAGIVLQGSEVKSLREGRVQLADAYARPRDGELWLHGVHISPWPQASGKWQPDPDRIRKLLLHRREIDRLVARVEQDRLTIIPLSIYFKDGRAKTEVALARRKRQHDKRATLARRDADREAERAMARHGRGG